MEEPTFIIEETLPGVDDDRYQVLWKKNAKDTTFHDAENEFKKLIETTKNRVELWYGCDSPIVLCSRPPLIYLHSIRV